VPLAEQPTENIYIDGTEHRLAALDAARNLNQNRKSTVI
jgi:hypothetical protein